MAHQVVDTGDTGVDKAEKVPALMNSERNRHHTSKPIRKYRDSERDWCYCERKGKSAGETRGRAHSPSYRPTRTRPSKGDWHLGGTRVTRESVRKVDSQELSPPTPESESTPSQARQWFMCTQKCEKHWARVTVASGQNSFFVSLSHSHTLSLCTSGK